MDRRVRWGGRDSLRVACTDIGMGWPVVQELLAVLKEDADRNLSVTEAEARVQ